jgi:hypothetical protein
MMMMPQCPLLTQVMAAKVAVLLEFLGQNAKFSHRWKHKDNNKLRKKLELTKVEKKIIKVMHKKMGTPAKKDAETSDAKKATDELNEAYKGAWAAGQKKGFGWLRSGR